MFVLIVFHGKYLISPQRKMENQEESAIEELQEDEKKY
jgi:hypothetical protein